MAEQVGHRIQVHIPDDNNEDQEVIEISTASGNISAETLLLPRILNRDSRLPPRTMGDYRVHVISADQTRISASIPIHTPFDSDITPVGSAVVITVVSSADPTPTGYQLPDVEDAYRNSDLDEAFRIMTAQSTPQDPLFEEHQ